MGRAFRSPEEPTEYDELVRAVVGALSPPRLKLERFRARAASSHDARPIRASPAEILAAFGRAPRLGQLAFRARYMDDRSTEVMVGGTMLLAKRLQDRRGRISRTIELLAATAFAEWSESDCRTCQGTGHHGDGKHERWVWATCARCEGRGRIAREGVNGAHCRMYFPSAWHAVSRPCTDELEVIVEGGAIRQVQHSGCGGVGKVRKWEEGAQQRLTCKDCHGSGRTSLGEFQRAVNLAMDLETFRRRWAAKYEQALEVLQKIHEATTTAIDIALGKPQYRVRASDTSDTLPDESYSTTPNQAEEQNADSPPPSLTGEVPTDFEQRPPGN